MLFKALLANPRGAKYSSGPELATPRFKTFYTYPAKALRRDHRELILAEYVDI